ncbi:MAG: carboxypeptidase-like regulatory domain-containing protein, partial [Terracidiphilus sp.]
MKTNEFADTMNVRRKRSGSWANALAILLGLVICLGWAATQAAAQTSGEGAIVGTVKDQTGAVIPNAKVTATNVATNIATTRTSSSAGYYVLSPLLPGTYSIKVTATDFKTLVQENVVLDALQTLGFNPVLAVGATTQTMIVTAAPPQLETENATLGLTMENTDYSNLPVQMNSGNQRDPTAFGTLTPGSQTGARLPVIGGTGSYLGQLYVDGMPAETVSQQGDNRLVSEAMDLDSVDQFQVLTSTPP